MEKHLTSILELNKSFYLDKDITESIYKSELLSKLQSIILDYNLFLQLKSNVFISEYTNVNLDDHISLSLNTINNTDILESSENLDEEDNEDNLDEEDNEEDNEDNLDEEDNEEEYISIDNQCCARIGKMLYNLEFLPSEFLDSYPSGTFMFNDGYVIGDSCKNKVKDYDDFNNYFCEEHLEGFEDIREEPENFS